MKGSTKEQHSSHLRKIGACLHHILNLRKENLLSTPERQSTWSAKRTWVMLKCFATNMDTLMNGSTVKNHISFKTVFGYSATQRTSFRSWFLVCQRVLPPTFHAYRAYPRNNPGKTLLPNWWILDWSFAEIGNNSTNEPNEMIGLLKGSPKRLSYGVFPSDKRSWMFRRQQ